MMEHTDPARSVNPGQESGGLIGFVLAHGGGWIPPGGSGLFSSKLLGLLAGKDARTIRDWVEKYSIPHRKAGQEMFIDPGDLAKFVPHFPLKE